MVTPRPSLPDEDLRDFFDNAAMSFHWVGPDGTILAANQAELDLLGYESHEYVGRNIAEFYVDQTQISDILRDLAAGQTMNERASLLRCKNGTTKEVVITSSVLWREGEFIHTRCLTRDVTGMRALESAAMHLSAVVESSDDAIVSKDLDGIVLSWNPGAERLFGYSSQDMIGRSIRLIIPVDRQSEEDEVLQRVRSGERVDHFQTIRRRKDGTLIPISLTVSPVKNAQGQIVGASKIARDITAQRAAEEAMRAAMRAKDQFSSLVSHELRTPIATIVGNGQLLLRRGHALPEDARTQALTDLVGEAERLQRIVENLLILTRVELETELQLVSHDPASLTEGVVAAMRRREPSREIRVSVQPGLPRIRADQALFSVVIENLISNAANYSAAGTPIEVSLVTGEPGWVEVHVLDRGDGIDADSVEKIFEPFFRSSAATVQTPGMGLGLAVSRTAAEAQGGRIMVTARPEGGADFCFSIPIDSGAAE